MIRLKFYKELDGVQFYIDESKNLYRKVSEERFELIYDREIYREFGLEYPDILDLGWVREIIKASEKKVVS